MSQPEHTKSIAVSLHDLAKHFGRFGALRGVTADFNAGRMYLVLGDNGAGKSTLLRIIAGLTAPSRGMVSVFGVPPKDARRSLGYMAHAPLLYDELDALENLTYFATLYGIRDRAQCEHAIQLVGLDPALKRRVGQYSQGMRQRLSLARAVIHEPSLLLLDEPFSNVDVTSARHMVQLLGSMRDAGRTIFVVTHQPALLENVADELVPLSQGKLLARESEAKSSMNEEVHR